MGRLSKTESRKFDHWWLPYKNKKRRLVSVRKKVYLSQVRASKMNSFYGRANDVRRKKPISKGGVK